MVGPARRSPRRRRAEIGSPRTDDPLAAAASLLLLTLLAPLVLAPAAQAYNDGRGFYGATNDKVVTDAGFILIIFFPLFVFPMSMLQRQPGETQGSAQGGAEGAWATPSGAAAGRRAPRRERAAAER